MSIARPKKQHHIGWQFWKFAPEAADDYQLDASEFLPDVQASDGYPLKLPTIRNYDTPTD